MVGGYGRQIGRGVRDPSRGGLVDPTLSHGGSQAYRAELVISVTAP